MKKVLFIFLIIFSIGGLTILMVRESFAQSLSDLAAKLPRKVGGWTAEAKDSTYDGETIYDYIDGGAEVYKAYNMQGCLSRRYAAKGETVIVLDIFDMGSPKDAFGVFTHDRGGKPLNVGQGALYRPGWLSFWKGRFFVSIYMALEPAGAEKALLDLASSVASHIKDQGPKPEIISVLPPEGLRVDTVRYLHHHVLLNYHFYVSDENILNLGPKTDAVLAAYERDEKTARLLLILYPDVESGKEARAKFLAHYLPEKKGEEAVMMEDGKWSDAALKKKLLIVVLEADRQLLAEELIGDVENPR